MDRITWKTRLLIIDYNTISYTSFDAFRLHLMLNKNDFHKMYVRHYDFLRMSPDDQLRYFFRNNTDRNPYHFLSDQFHSTSPVGLELRKLTNEYYANANMMTKRTTTVINTNLWVGLANQTIEEIHVMRHPLETSQLFLRDDVKIVTTEDLFNAEMIAHYMDRHRLNSVILDSVDLALSISPLLKNTTFLFGTYRYNCEPKKSENEFWIHKRATEINEFQKTLHHEYGQFEPFQLRRTT